MLKALILAALVQSAGNVTDGAEGSATVECLVGERNSIAECRVVQESPRGQGFGAAAISMVRREQSAAKNGVKPGQWFRRTVRFRLPIDDASEAPQPQASPTEDAGRWV